jgi:GntR family transcriptional repressor for pyruvate dehydrogenase complex
MAGVKRRGRVSGSFLTVALFCQAYCWFNGPMPAAKVKNDEAIGPSTESRFTAIAQPRAHDFVVEQIRRQISLGIIAPGSSLPPERELMKMFGTGRVTVQLAIGQLEAEHVIETRRGRTGGSFVKAPDADSHSLDFRVVELRRQANRLLQALEYRSVLEPSATKLAAGKIKARQLKDLSDIIEKTDSAEDDPEFMRWDTAFHLAIAKATANDFMIEALEQIRLTLNPALQLLPDTKPWHERSNQDHHEILGALRRHDTDGAGALMSTHIAHTDKSIRSLMKTLTRT